MTQAERKMMWQKRVAAFKESGQSTTSWCKENNVKVHQLRYWLRKEKQTQDTPATETCSWLPLDIKESESSSLTIHIGQAAIEVKPGYDPQLLLDVVTTLKNAK